MSPYRTPTRRLALVGIGTMVAGCLGDDTDDTETADGDPPSGGPAMGERELSGNFPVVLEDSETGETVADVHYHDDDGTHWHAQPIAVPFEDERTLTVRVLDAAEEALELGEDSEYSISFNRDEEAPDVVAVTIEGAQLQVVGREPGRTRPTLTVTGPDDASWETPTMIFEVEAD